MVAILFPNLFSGFNLFLNSKYTNIWTRFQESSRF